MKILQLGGAFHQSFFIEELSLNNYFVESLDNIPKNPGHTYSKRSHNISIMDILSIRKIISNDQYLISSFGSDMAELSRNILVDDYGKHIKLLKKFSARLFLQKVFKEQNQPNIKLASFKENIGNNYFVVKPNISSGSKSVSIINSNIKLKESIKNAQKSSLDGLAIMEEFIQNDGNKYYCEGLIINNEIILVFGCSKSSKNNIIWDGSLEITQDNISSYTQLSYKDLEENLKECVARMAQAIEKNSFAFNIDFFIRDKKIVIIEFSPRPGGNLLHMVLENRFNINYSLTYLSIIKDFPKIYYRKEPLFSKNLFKSMSISIKCLNKIKNIQHIKSEKFITLMRDYPSKEYDEKLIGIIHES